MAALGDKNVGRLDVTVNDSFGVRGVQSVRNLNSPFEHIFQSATASPAMRCFQRRALHEFHGDERSAVLLADLVDGADIGMVQRGSRARLSAKTLQSLRILRHVVGQKFQRNEATEE